MLSAASQDRRRGRATRRGTGTTAREGASDAVAAEAREIVRRAVGDAAGLTIKGQLRRAAEHLGYEADLWRVREAFYGRAGGWGAAALDDLRRRFAAWRGREAATAADPSVLARHVRAVRAALARLDRELADVEAEVARLTAGAPDG